MMTEQRPHVFPAADGLHDRHDYDEAALRGADLPEDPVVLLRDWLAHAATVDQGVEPGAMVLATTDPVAGVTQRTVLLRRIDGEDLLFFTSYASRKGLAIAADARVSLLFRWTGPVRQVEVGGRARRASAADSDAYWATRPRGSRIGAHASPQSEPLDRAELDARVAAVVQRFEGVADVPRPPDWGGYRVTPLRMEFWQGRSNRLHDRFRYRRATPEEAWVRRRLAP